jgi:transposase
MMWPQLIFVLLITDVVHGPATNPLRASVTEEDQRAFIKCQVLLSASVPDVCKMLTTIAGRNAYSRSQVYKIYEQFAEQGRLTCQDAPREGRPCTATDSEHQTSLELLLDEDRCWTSEELAFRLGISKTSTLRMLYQLEVRKVSSRWVPYALTHAQKELRVSTSQEHLKRSREDPEFLDRIIAIDETWIKSYDARDASSSREWRYPGEAP